MSAKVEPAAWSEWLLRETGMSEAVRASLGMRGTPTSGPSPSSAIDSEPPSARSASSLSSPACQETVEELTTQIAEIKRLEKTLKLIRGSKEKRLKILKDRDGGGGLPPARPAVSSSDSVGYYPPARPAVSSSESGVYYPPARAAVSSSESGVYAPARPSMSSSDSVSLALDDDRPLSPSCLPPPAPVNNVRRLSRGNPVSALGGSVIPEHDAFCSPVCGGGPPPPTLPPPIRTLAPQGHGMAHAHAHTQPLSVLSPPWSPPPHTDHKQGMAYHPPHDARRHSLQHLQQRVDYSSYTQFGAVGSHAPAPPPPMAPPPPPHPEFSPLYPPTLGVGVVTEPPAASRSPAAPEPVRPPVIGSGRPPPAVHHQASAPAVMRQYVMATTLEPYGDDLAPLPEASPGVADQSLPFFRTLHNRKPSSDLPAAAKLLESEAATPPPAS